MTIQMAGILGLSMLTVVLMVTRRLPAILALSIMTVGTALIAGIPSIDREFNIAKDVLEADSMRMNTAIAGLFFNGFFSEILSRVSITNTIIHKVTEMAGDKPLPIAYVSLIMASIVFAASNGLGMFILAGTVIVPITISAGLSPLVAGTILLLGNDIGATFSVGTLGVYINTLELSLETVTRYSFLCAVPLIVVPVIMIYMMIKSGGKERKAWAMPSPDMRSEKSVRSIVLISPLIPVALVLALKLPLVPAILIRIVLTLILATPKNAVHVVSSSFVEGIQETAGACGLIIGIGMVLEAVIAPRIAAVLESVIKAIIPSNVTMFILVSGLLSPLVIYHGPLNVWDLGSGIVTLLASCGVNPVATMVALRLDFSVQAVCDPANSHSVRVADFTKADANDFLKKTILWITVSTLAELIVANSVVL